MVLLNDQLNDQLQKPLYCSITTLVDQKGNIQPESHFLDFYLEPTTVLGKKIL